MEIAVSPMRRPAPGQARWIVTGAAGFIGRRLCEHLRLQGHEVWALLRRPEEGPWDHAFCSDLSADALPQGLMDGVDGVFHLANIAHTDLRGEEADRYWRVNVVGTAALLNAAVDARVSGFVYLSSVNAMGAPGDECIDESWERLPESAYGRSKREAERLVLATGAESGMHVCNLRPALVYGPGVKGNLSRMLQAVRRGHFPPLPDFGNRRTMIAVDDLIAAVHLAMENPRANGNTYIVADGVGYSPRALYLAMRHAYGLPAPRWTLPGNLLRLTAAVGDLIERLTTRRMPLNSEVLARLTSSACYRADRIREELGWRPEKTFFDLLPEMVGPRLLDANSGDRGKS